MQNVHCESFLLKSLRNKAGDFFFIFNNQNTHGSSASTPQGKDSTVAARDECGDVGKDARQFQPPWIGQVTRLPHWFELLLEYSQSLEVVDRFSVFVQKNTSS